MRQYVKDELTKFKHLPLAERLSTYEEFKKTLLPHDKDMFDRVLKDEARMAEQAEEEARAKAEADRLRREAEMKRRLEVRRQRELELQAEVKRAKEAKSEEEEYRKKYSSLFASKK
jgi:uncharacterized membrane protein YqiK